MGVKIFIGYPLPKALQEIPLGLISQKHKGKSYIGTFIETDRLTLYALREELSRLIGKLEHLLCVNTEHPILFCDLFLGG